jgi:hypothetical protein
VGVAEELARIAAAAAAHAEPGESVTGVVAAEPAGGERVYLCSFERGEERSWLALDESGGPLADPSLVREAASISALCEVAEETAGGGNLEELRAQLMRLRLTEAPVGIEEAEAAALELEQVIGSPPRVASVDYLDAVGAAVRRLEQALGETSLSPFATAMQQALGAADGLADDVVAHYKLSMYRGR